MVSTSSSQVERLFSSTGTPSDGDWGVGAALQGAMADPASWEAVPSLNVVRPESLPPGSLVRYRGMIQVFASGGRHLSDLPTAILSPCHRGRHPTTTVRTFSPATFVPMRMLRAGDFRSRVLCRGVQEPGRRLAHDKVLRRHGPFCVSRRRGAPPPVLPESVRPTREGGVLGESTSIGARLPPSCVADRHVGAAPHVLRPGPRRVPLVLGGGRPPGGSLPRRRRPQEGPVPVPRPRRGCCSRWRRRSSCPASRSG